MANETKSNPIVVDSTGLLFTGQGRVNAVVFINDGADADHSLEIRDDTATGSSNLLVKLELTAERKTEAVAFPGGAAFTRGLYCQAIDGGKALVYLA